MEETSDRDVFLTISFNRNGEWVMSQQGKHIAREFLATPPDSKTLEKVTTIVLYRKKTDSGQKKKPPCLELIDPPGIWICACDTPGDC